MSNYKGKNKGKDELSKDMNKDRGRKGNVNVKRRNGKQSKFSSPETNTQRQNDPNWYFTSPELAQQAAQLSFQNFLGQGQVLGYYETPTIARIDMGLSPSTTHFANVIRNNAVVTGDGYPIATGGQIPAPVSSKAGVNMMADKLYTLLSSFTGRTASYGPQDVAMMIMAIAAAAEWSEAIRRVFGVALTYNPRNRSLPEGLIRSMGVDVTDLRANMSIYRMRFNMALARINQIPLLENIAYIKKARDLYQRIYQDDPTSMSQYFYFMPNYVYTIDERSSETGTELIATRLTAIAQEHGEDESSCKLEYWLGAFEDMITQLLESSTLNFIYADLLNMANKLSVPTWKFDYLAENYTVLPEYNVTALMQFHNLTIVGEPHEFENKTWTVVDSERITNGANIYSDVDNNEVIFNPAFGESASSYRWGIVNKAVLDLPMDNPTIEDKIEALRFVSLGCGIRRSASAINMSTDTNHYYTTMVALPDHYVTGVMVFQNIYADSEELYSSAMLINGSAMLNGGSTAVACEVSQFEHFPILYFGLVSSDKQTITSYKVYGQLQFYAEYDYMYIARVLDCISIGLFDFRV